MPNAPSETEHALLDEIMKRHNLKNDAALSRYLGIKPPSISKIRSRAMPISASVVLIIHEKTGLPVADIRHLMKWADAVGVPVERAA